MIKNSFLLLICICAVKCAAQNKKSADLTHWTLKCSPLGLIEADQAISFATEFKPKPRLGIQLEGSFIFNTIYFSQERSITNTRGFRIVPEIRYYDKGFKKNLHRYVGLQLSYKQVEKDVEQWVRKMSYRQLESIHLKKNNLAAIFIGGLQNHGHRINIDFNIGLGFKYKTMNDNYHPKDITAFSEQYGEPLGGYYPTLSGTFKLVYKLK